MIMGLSKLVQEAMENPVKVVHMHAQTSGTATARRVPLGIGEKEAALLLAVDFKSRMYSNLAHYGYQWLWRKSHLTEIPWNPTTQDWSNVDNNYGILDYFQVAMYKATDVGFSRSTHRNSKLYPQPVLISNDPSWVIWHSGNAMYMTMSLWYKKVQLTDKEMIKLLVKNP